MNKVEEQDESVATEDAIDAADASAELTDELASDEEIASPKESAADEIKRLEEEGEVAADYLEELLDIVDMDGDIDIDVEHGRASLAIIAEGGGGRLARLVGKDGEVLDALQELTRLAAQTKTGYRSRLMLDINDHRAKQKAELVVIATAVIEQVKSSGKSVALAAMNPFERKVVHDTVAAAGLTSESEGVEPQRRVVVLPAE